jgi:putative transcriptional regulator
MKKPESGTILIASPHLDDPNFWKTVVFLCGYDNDGSFGFVLNRKLDITLNDLFLEMKGVPFPVYEGGPVEPHTLHFLHQYPNEIEGGQEVMKGVYWGGNFERLKEMIYEGKIDASKIRFFLGYSGWSEGQLESEIEEKTWMLCDAQQKFIFSEDDTQLWKETLNQMGDEYKLVIHAPLDPQMN